MAEIPSWQRQNYAKNASTGPSTMNSKIAGNNISSMHSKIARPSVRNYADGGEVKPEYDQGEFAGVDDAVRANKVVYEDDVAPRVATDDEMRAVAPKNDDAASEVKVDGVGAGKQSFKQAFAAARAAGKDSFTWDGKPGMTFSTKLATSKEAPRMAAKTDGPKAQGKTFAQDVAERKASMSVEKTVERAMARDENYGNEGRRSVVSRPATGRGVIDTSNIDSKTLLPKR